MSFIKKLDTMIMLLEDGYTTSEIDEKLGGAKNSSFCYLRNNRSKLKDVRFIQRRIYVKRNFWSTKRDR